MISQGLPDTRDGGVMHTALFFFFFFLWCLIFAAGRGVRGNKSPKTEDFSGGGATLAFAQHSLGHGKATAVH